MPNRSPTPAQAIALNDMAEEFLKINREIDAYEIPQITMREMKGETIEVWERVAAMLSAHHARATTASPKKRAWASESASRLSREWNDAFRRIMSSVA